MEEKPEYIYTTLKEPVPITEQVWPENVFPLVSTSTLTYNHAPYIRECIEGILMQKTTFPVRVVVFDDCSTDGTREIVQEYEAKFPNLIKGFYPKENTYGKPGRNETLKPRNEARDIAKYIALCEGDDYWTDPLKLQKQVEFLEKNEEFTLHFHAAQNFIEKAGKYIDRKPIISKEYFGADFLDNWIIPTSSVLFRNVLDSDIYSRLSNKNYLFGDIILFLSLAEKGKVYGSNCIMTTYRIHGKSMLRELDKENLFLSGKKFIQHHKEMSCDFSRKYKHLNHLFISNKYLEFFNNESSLLKRIKFFILFNKHTLVAGNRYFFSFYHLKVFIFNFIKFFKFRKTKITNSI